MSCDHLGKCEDSCVKRIEKLLLLICDTNVIPFRVLGCLTEAMLLSDVTLIDVSEEKRDKREHGRSYEHIILKEYASKTEL